MSRIKSLHRTAALAALALATGITSAHATNLVVNGSFSNLAIPGAASQIGLGGQFVTGWTSALFVPGVHSYNFVFTPGSADTTGASGLSLWGPNNGSMNGLPTTSPDGGNFLGLDGVYRPGLFYQTINGLTVGKKYIVSFYWAGAQQYTFYGPTTEAFDVSLGGQTISTGFVSNTSHGFTGWQKQSLVFTADNTSDVLSFLAQGTPAGVPPFSLLDGVSLDAESPVPEPSSLALLLTGVIGAGGLVRRRFKSTAV